MKCPHCNKPVKLVRSGEFPVEQDREEADRMGRPQQTYLPVKDLDEALIEHNEDLEIAIGEGVTIYAPKHFFKDKSKWIAINKIIKAHGGKWISMGEGSRWEVPT